MDSVGTYEAKTNPSRLLGACYQGRKDNNNQARRAVGRSAAPCLFTEGNATTGHCRNTAVSK